MRLDQACDIVGVTQHASVAEIRAAYLDLVKVWHPDRFPGASRLRQDSPSIEMISA